MGAVRARLLNLVHYVVLGVAVINISTASILVRLAGSEGVHGFTVASWRLVISSAITWVLLLVLGGRGLTRFLVNPRDLILMAVSGVALALHFMLWMYSLAHINVAASVTIVDSYPALLALIGRFILGEGYSIAQYIGSLVAFLGILGLSLSSYTGELAPPGGDPVFGALLAFGGMLSVSAYFTIGKVMRARYSTLEYTAVVYTVGAVVAVPLTVLAGVNLFNPTPRAWVFIALVALIPMLGGHTLINYVIGRLSLLAATVPVLGEPIGATLLALIILGEPVNQEIAAFMALTLSGIAMVLVWEELRSRAGEHPPPRVSSGGLNHVGSSLPTKTA